MHFFPNLCLQILASAVEQDHRRLCAPSGRSLVPICGGGSRFAAGEAAQTGRVRVVRDGLQGGGRSLRGPLHPESSVFLLRRFF
jgi:hypothetical protein